MYIRAVIKRGQSLSLAESITGGHLPRTKGTDPQTFTVGSVDAVDLTDSALLCRPSVVFRTNLYVRSLEDAGSVGVRT